MLSCYQAKAKSSTIKATTLKLFTAKALKVELKSHIFWSIVGQKL